MENLKVGIAGLGRIGKIHLNNLLQMQNVDISAAMDPDEEAQKYAKSKGVKLVFKTYKELLNVHEIKALIISPSLITPIIFFFNYMHPN